MYSKLLKALRQKTTLAAIIANTAVAGCVSLYAPIDGLSIKVPKTAQVNKDLREKLAFIDDVKKAGVNRFGLKESPHYSEYNDGSLPVDTLYMLLVTSPIYLPESQSLQYIPINSDQEYRETLGGFAYFYSHADKLDDEKEYYQKQGYDVYRRFTTNYNDEERGSPITGEFLQQSKVQQARTVFHENCHYWVAEHVGNNFSSELNESFCQVVGYTGAINYFKSREGENAPDYKHAVDSFNGYYRYSQEINYYYFRLQRIYNDQKLTLEEKLNQREEVFGEAESALGEIDNAVLCDYYPYTKYFPLLLKFHESHGGNLRTTLEKMKDCPETEKEALEYIRKNSKKII